MYRRDKRKDRKTMKGFSLDLQELKIVHHADHDINSNFINIPSNNVNRNVNNLSTN